MNLDLLEIITAVALFLAQAAVGVYLYMTKKSQVNASRIDDLEKEFEKKLDHQASQTAAEDKRLQGEIHGLSGRVSQVEGSRPTLEKLSKDVGKVHARVDETNKILSRLEGEFLATKGTLGLIHEYLLTNGRERK